MTAPNQPNIITSSTMNPARTIHGPGPKLLNQNAAPIPMSRSATAPTTGHGDGCGTK